MNYLAHLFLSKNNKDITVGNFIADGIRGNAIHHFPDGIKKGISLHRKIDSYTDAHPVYLQSKHRFSSVYDKYSGILMDIFYDHFLAKKFSIFSAIPLELYVVRCYTLLEDYYTIMPLRSQQFYKYMITRNTLYSYRTIEGIDVVLNHLSSRINSSYELDNSISILQENYDIIEQEFFLFFDELQSYVFAQEEFLDN